MHRAFGDYIRERRKDLGLSQEQLAARVGGACSQSDISRIERGLVQLPRMTTLVSLAASLEVSVGDLLIASGWFEDEDIVSSLTSGVTEPDALETALSAIEAELDTIQDLESQANVRSERLRRTVRALASTMSNAGPGPCRDHVESEGVVSVVEGWTRDDVTSVG
jgi:transcriptional regulator with XRE-family HTH domain